MITKELIEYIKKSKSTGKTEEELKSTLLSTGWTTADLEEAFKQILVNENIPTPLNSFQNNQNLNIASVGLKKTNGRLFSTIFILLVLVMGVTAFFFREKLVNLPIFYPKTDEALINIQEQSPATTNPDEGVSPAVCDNYDCLISAVSNCTPESAIISFKDIKNPLLNNIIMSGKTQYEIKKSASANKCDIESTTLEIKFIFASPTTDPKDIAQLEAMNNDLKSPMTANAKTKSLCTADIPALTSLLIDARNGKSGTSETEINTDFKTEVTMDSLQSSSKTIITTTTGQKISCSVTVSQ